MSFGISCTMGPSGVLIPLSSDDMTPGILVDKLYLMPGTSTTRYYPEFTGTLLYVLKYSSEVLYNTSYSTVNMAAKSVYCQVGNPFGPKPSCLFVILGR